MASKTIVNLSVLVLCLPLVLCRPQNTTDGRLKPKYPPSDVTFYSRDLKLNMTIDELISLQLGDIEGTANKMMDVGVVGGAGSILVELDILLTTKQYAAFYPPPSSNPSYRKKRKAIRSSVYRWTNAEIPFVFSVNTFNSEEKFMIEEAMTEWERYTCIKFKPVKETDKNVLHYINGNSCSSQLGMVGGVQALHLQAPGCRFRGLYLHEIGHALGLIHEHTRPDRDSYIDVLFGNVSPGLASQFTKRSIEQIDLMNTQYEYSSIMHYGVTAFSRDGVSKTIRTKDPAREKEIGKVYLKELSFNDVKAVNNMYSCASACPSNIQCRDGGFVDQTCRCICPDGSRDCEVGFIKPTNDADCSNEYDDWQCYIWANSGQCLRNRKFMSTSCKRACQFCDSVEPNKEECEDVYPEAKCAVWRERGDCAANEHWMSRNCKKTCNACVDKNQRVETKCENKHSDTEKCDQWAAEGECQVNLVWMLNNCQKSCQHCHKTPPDIDETTGDTCGDTWYDKASCQNWANTGECDANPTWMLLNCKESCGECPGGVKPTPQSCSDSHAQCSEKASEGECVRNKDWMKQNCPKTCGFCNGGTDEGECKDSNDQCPGWAEGGECDLNPVWMRDNCRLSCGTCPGVTKPDNGECKDSNDQCPGWAEGGECDLNPVWMRDNCRVSCGTCPGVTKPDNGECKDTDTMCRSWADQGECDLNPVWMKVNCRVSCGTCPGVTERPDKNCVDSDSECPKFAEDGICDRDVWMQKNCKYSCYLCRDKPTTEQPNVPCVNKHDYKDCTIWANSGHCDINPDYMHKNCRKACKLCTDGTDKPEKCEDTHQDKAACIDWASTNQCSENPDWMLVNCKKSCGQCKPVTETKPTSKCADIHYDKKACRNWAKHGECTNNPGWMLINCMESCGECQQVTTSTTTSDEEELNSGSNTIRTSSAILMPFLTVVLSLLNKLC